MSTFYFFDSSDIVAHIETMIAMTSADHVGIGTDFVDYVEDVYIHKMKAIGAITFPDAAILRREILSYRGRGGMFPSSRRSATS